MLSIICPYNNQELLNEYLIPSINEQIGVEYETIYLDSKEMHFKSASEALNYGVEISKGNVLVFAHQDIKLLDREILKKIQYYAEKYDFGIGCVAGVVEKPYQKITSVVHGSKMEQCGLPVEKEKIVDSCDECFFFIKKSDFIGFSDLGKTWHLYAVEYCMNCRVKSKKIMVFPLPIFHVSPGWSINANYWMALNRLSNKYKGIAEYIPTTTGLFKNDSKLKLLIYYKVFRAEIKRLLISLKVRKQTWDLL